MQSPAPSDGGPGPLRKAARWLDLLFPAPCAGCGAGLGRAPNPWFCKTCWEGIPCLSGPVCDRCGIPFAAPESVLDGLRFACGDCLKVAPPFGMARVLGPYEGALAAAVKLLKYAGQTGLAPVLVDRVAPDAHPPEVWAVDVVIAVPLHLRRLRARGYNQAAWLARALARRIGRPVAENVLVRRTATRPQVGLDRAERTRNVGGAFTVDDPGRVAGRTVLLVDDVITTGATARACARALRAAGAEQVHVWAVARQGLDRPEPHDWSGIVGGGTPR